MPAMFVWFESANSNSDQKTKKKREGKQTSYSPQWGLKKGEFEKAQEGQTTSYVVKAVNRSYMWRIRLLRISANALYCKEKIKKAPARREKKKLSEEMVCQPITTT